jgi:CPA1 family monovalent cation:H+ antiporter
MREVDDYIISVLVTLSVVMGGYLIARQMHISGPLTMVAAGLFMGNFNVKFQNEIRNPGLSDQILGADR